jgi:hypothetical protein
MRNRVIVAAFATLVAAPVYAQSSEVTGQWTLTAPMVMCTDLPVAARPVPRLVVAGPHVTDGRTAMTAGLIVINRSPEDGLAIGQRYLAQRMRGDKQLFSKKNEGYGDLRFAGIVTVRAIDENNALASVDFACDSVETGDMLEPFVEVPLPNAAAAPIKPDFTDRAKLLFGVDNRVMFGHGDVFSIERGTAQGVTPGARYAIYRDFHNNLPLVYVADVVVMSVHEQTSKVVVTQAVDSIEPGDIAVPRTRAQD